MFLKKSLGQHILIAEPSIEKIVRTLAPTGDDVVMEIGPGTGKLTKHLLKVAGRVMAVETDREMIERLASEFGDAENLEIVHADFLKFDLACALKNVRSGALFCGNLPYNISSPILFKLKENRKLFKRGVVMLQKEVARRLVSQPGTKDYGILSILMQSAAKIKKCFDLSPGCFVPPPKVTSTVVEIIFHENNPYGIADESTFANIIKKAFHGRRKMIRNTVKKEHLPLLETCGIDPRSRPEEISIDSFAKLSNLAGS